MKKINGEKGAISILVILTMLFFVSFLVVTYIFVSNKADIQMEATRQVKDMYEQDANEIYNSYFANNETETNVIIPIYTVEQLLKIGSNEYIQIKEVGGKYYYFSPSATYILMNNLNFESDEWNVEKLENINFDWNDKTITINNEEFPIDYTYILENQRNRGFIESNDTLKTETLHKIYIAERETGLSPNCFRVFKETKNGETNEYVAYLYGEVYIESYVKDENGEGDGEASYIARVEKINLLNTLVDGMLVGDINEDYNIDEKDCDDIGWMNSYNYDFSKYPENDSWWLFCYHAILSDVNQDGSADGGDTSCLYEYIYNDDSIINYIVKYDIENGYGSWLDMELKSYNY